MVRSDRASDVLEPTPARGRLDAMGLRRDLPGWVPSVVEPIDAPEPDPAPPVTAAVADLGPREGPSLEAMAKAWVLDRVPPWSHELVDRVRLRKVVVVLLVVVALVVGLVVLTLHRSGGSDPAAYDGSTSDAYPTSADQATAAPVAPVASIPTTIVVDVGGRVRKPGLVTLPAGARVADALAAAGGPLRHKEIATVDLAARVSDGQLLLVGVPGASTGAAAAAGDGGGGSDPGVAPTPISLSTATLAELENLPGVGPVTAQKIIDWRTANNGFTSVEQLQQVSGIGPSHYAAISPLVTP